MILHYVELNDGKRYVHKQECQGIAAQYRAGDVWEIEVPFGDEDETIVAVWEDYFGDTWPDDDEIDAQAELTVFDRCTDPYFPAAEDEDSGNPKADAFMEEAIAAGWDVEWEWLDYDVDAVSVVAKRDYVAESLRTHEELHLSWYKNRMESAFYVDGHEDSVAKVLSSVAAARPYLVGKPPQPKRKETARKERTTPTKRELREKIPFDLEEAYDDEILAACRGRKVVWRNTISGDYESALVLGKNSAHYKIELGQAGRAILTFMSPEGFRSVALENLVQVK